MEKVGVKENLLEFEKGQQIQKNVNLITHLMKWNSFFDLDINNEYLLEGLIPKGAITLLFSRGGLGKTSLMLQVSHAIAEGIPFGKLQTIKTPVYFVDFENPLTFLKERIEKIGRSENLYVWHISNDPMPPRLDSKEWKLYKSLPPGLLVFDTLRAGHLLDENNSKDMALIVSRLKELREVGFSIILLHHTPKGNDAIYKGSTAILDLADHVLGLEALKDIEDDAEFDPHKTYKLSVRLKTRYEPNSIYLTFNPEIKGFEPAKDPDVEKMEEIQCILKEAKKPIKQKDLIERLKQELGLSKEHARKLLKKGTGVFWETSKGERNATLYSMPNSVFQKSSIYIEQKTGKLEATPEKTPENTFKENNNQPIENVKLSSFLMEFQKNEKQILPIEECIIDENNDFILEIVENEGDSIVDQDHWEQ